ncbi:BGL1A, partial [Symbiodinium natans]
IEGAHDADGKAPSIWDDFCRKPGNIEDGTSADIACDFYHRYEEDIELARAAGFKHFRMSISWPRVMREDGLPNEPGIAFYSSVLDALEKANMTPCVTLYHWDLPSSLQTADMPGWMSPKIVDIFVEYATLCFTRFASRVPMWITFNEPAVFVFGGYQGGWNAPGIKQSVAEALVAMRHVLLAHAKVVALYRARFQLGEKTGKIGITLNTRHYTPVDASDVAAKGAQQMLEDRIASWSDPVLFGDFPSSFKATHAGNLALRLSQSEQETLRGSIDFLGINYYTTSGVEEAGGSSWKIVDLGEASGASWLRSYPSGLLLLLRWLSGRYPGLDIVITENGFCTPANDPEPIKDDVRVRYYQDHTRVVKEAVAEGLPLRGYFAWTLLDNFEWAGGYKERFGMVHVNFEDEALARTVKSSYR